MAAKRWSDEQRAEALELLKAAGPTDVARQLGIPVETVKSWARRAGIRAPVTTATRREAVEAAELTMEARRLAMAESIAKDVGVILRRLTAATEYVYVKTVGTGEGRSAVEEHRVYLDMPTAADTRNLASAAAVLIDKMQLLSGEATSRPDLGGYDLEAELRAYQQGVADREAAEA